MSKEKEVRTFTLTTVRIEKTLYAKFKKKCDEQNKKYIAEIERLISDGIIREVGDGK